MKLIFTIAGVVILSSFAFGQSSISVEHDANGNPIVFGRNGDNLTVCTESGCSQQSFSGNYVQRFCLSCTGDDTPKARMALKLAYASSQIDLMWLKIYEQEKDGFLHQEMQRNAKCLLQIQNER